MLRLSDWFYASGRDAISNGKGRRKEKGISFNDGPTDRGFTGRVAPSQRTKEIDETSLS